MFVVDTNVLVYAANRDAPQHEAFHDWLEARRAGPDAWFLTWPIVYEFLRVVTHPRVLTAPWPVTEAWGFVEALRGGPGLEFLVEADQHDEVLSAVLAEMPSLRGNVVHDLHTAVLMREHGVRRIATRDTEFHRFPFLEPFDPLP